MKKILVLFILFVISGLYYPLYSYEAARISPAEAIHLVEYCLKNNAVGNRLMVTEIQPATHQRHPAFNILGTIGQDGYQALVDAKVGRVLKIWKNGTLFYKWKGIQVVGHRGTVKFAPENTLPAFEAAIKYGADLVEIDVRETRDGKLVIIHDATVDRTTNGTGLVAEMTLKQIKQLDAGAWFSEKFTGVRVPTLEEAVNAMAGKALPDIDFKAGTPAKLINILKEKNLLGKVTLYCGDWDLMRETIKQAPKGFHIRPTVPKGEIGLPIILQELNPSIVNINWEQFSERLVRKVHLVGKKSFVNTMQQDTQFILEMAIDTAPDYLQSDHLDLLMPLLRAKGLHK